jgi:hypothetical protein
MLIRTAEIGQKQSFADYLVDNHLIKATQSTLTDRLSVCLGKIEPLNSEYPNVDSKAFDKNGMEFMLKVNSPKISVLH